MGVAIIILSILSITAVAYIIIIMQPALWELAIKNPYFCSNYDETTDRCITLSGDVDPNLIQMVQNLYNASLMIPIVVGIGVVALWGYLAIARKDFD